MEADQLEDNLRRAATLIKAADAIFLTNGAGLGVDSGLGTFRGRHEQKGGWGPLERLEETPYSMSKPRRFDTDARLAWGYHFGRYVEFEQAVPHDGYRIMLDWCKSKPRGFAIFTSNIDSHWTRVLATHEAEPQALVEYHGNMSLMQCHHNCRKVWPTKDTVSLTQYTVDPVTGRADGTSTCPSCGGLARFNVCLIADTLFNDAKRIKQEQLWNAYVEELNKGPAVNVVVIEVGAGTGIPTVRRKSGEITRMIPGAKLIRINLDDPELDLSVDRGHISADPGHVSIGDLGALEAITRLARLMEN
jgi:NAD-dependent SIR2 family protein deacetylase